MDHKGLIRGRTLGRGHMLPGTRPGTYSEPKEAYTQYASPGAHVEDRGPRDLYQATVACYEECAPGGKRIYAGRGLRQYVEHRGLTRDMWP